MNPEHPSRRLGSKDVWTVEFQGSVVKVAFCNGSRPSPGPDDHHWFKRAYQTLFHQLVMSYPKEQRVILPDGSLTVDFSRDRLRQLEAEAWTKALDLKREYSARGKRGAVVQFSRKSRKRLIERCARLREDVEGLFITFTYQYNLLDHREAKHHLDLMLRWLMYHRPGCAIIWRMEHQGRGAIHFHLMLLGSTWVAVRGVRTQWRKLVGDYAGNVDIQRIRNRRKAMNYVAKYIAKDADAAALSEALRLDDMPYSENASPEDASEAESGDTGDEKAAAPGAVWLGRFWGIVGRKNMPYGVMVKFQFVGSPVALLDFRRAARRFRPRLFKRNRLVGFALYVDDLWRWLRLWYCCEQSRSLDAHVMSGAETALQIARGGPLVRSPLESNYELRK